jgi:hypothetical protein
MHVKYKQDNLHRMTRNIGTCGIMAMGLLYMLALWSNACRVYESWIQWLFVVVVALTGSRYRTDIISSVGYLRSNLVMQLVLCTVACNIRGTGILLQVSRDSANPTKKR